MTESSFCEQRERIGLVITMTVYKYKRAPPIGVMVSVSSGGLAVKHSALVANGYRLNPRKRSKLFRD